ncbi:ferritin-like domain-containing protein [Halpernia sp.]|uniref:ferritin-like domain-containing protein n=1 Tax=Halpernia sp. TaxID=2782209 RepID=UPI003A91AB9F
MKSQRDFIDQCEEKFKDVGSADFLTGLIQEHEKMAWKLRKYFKVTPETTSKK